MPTPEHEKIKILIGDFIKVLLEKDDRDYEPFGSSTFKKPDRVGLEPDDCFYIQNYATMVGKLRVNLSVDPPPDLAVEVDVTSTTQLNVYRAIAVPELWIFSNGKLKIFRFQLDNNDYTEAIASSIFETIPVKEIVPQFVDRGLTAGVSQAKRELRKWLRDRLNPNL